MTDPFKLDVDPKIIISVVEVLETEFPELSRASVELQAISLVTAVEWAPSLHHNGAEDRETLRMLEKSLGRVKKALINISPWAQDALAMSLHQNYMSRPFNPDVLRPPLGVDELRSVIEDWMPAANRAEQLLESGRANHGKNWRAIALIDNARRAWKANKGKSPPRRKLNEETKFAEFLRKLFKAIGVDAGVVRAYDAWYDYASDPNSLLDPPEYL